MKISRLALAIACGFATPAAFAVDIGPFSIYGTLHTAVEFVNVEANGVVLKTTDVSQTRLADQTSKLGFKVKHDLGDGVSGLAQVESRVRLGNGGDNTDNKAELGSRNTFVGLGSQTFGTVRMGRYDNAYKLASNLMGELNANLNDSNADTILGRLGGRQGDLVAYESPNWAGWTVLASYNMGRDSTNSISGGSANNTAKNTVATDLMPQLSAAIGYKAGPFTAGLGTTTLNNAAWQLDASSAPKAENLAGGKELRAWQIGAGYAFGEYTIAVVMERTNSSRSSSSSFDQAQSTTGIVGGYKSGPISVDLRIARAEDVIGSTNGAAVTADTGATQMGIAVGYQLHKNVQLIGSYMKLDNNTNAKFTNASGFSLDKGVDMNQVALGVSVSF